MNILITSPSLDTSDNISGISTVVNNILDETNLNYSHFLVGKKDRQKRNVAWVYNQLVLPIKLIDSISKNKIEILHLNAPLETFAIVRDFILLKVSKLLGIKVLLHIHGGNYLNNPPVYNSFFYRFLKYYFISADHFIVLSEFEKDLLIRKFRLKKEKIAILENCVRIPESFYKKNNKKVEIIFLGRIEKNKGILDIVDALSKLIKERSDFNFKLYGTGSIEEEITRELSHILGINFQFKGIVSGKEKNMAFQNADIFLLPSYYEGLPLSLLEAMSYGVIPIVTDVGSISTVVKNEFNGFFVETNDIDGLFTIINKLIDNYYNKSIKNMRYNITNSIEQKFSCKEYVNELERIYNKLLIKS